MRKFLLIVLAVSSLSAISYAQAPHSPEQMSDQQASESQPAQQPSLGDYARQLRLKKQQKQAEIQQAKAKQVQPLEVQNAEPTPAPQPKAQLVTKDENPERATLTQASVHQVTPANSDSQTGTNDHSAQGENWKSQILAQKQAVADLAQDIKTLSDSIHFAGANCVANCAQWNEHQQQKQQDLETIRAQLEEQKKVLEDMQEQARKAGFGSTITDP
jgi:hypothetical protein